MVDLKNDPAYNDDSQPSVTNATEALKLADEMAGVKAVEVAIPAPADAIDLAYRKAIADVDADQAGQEVAALQDKGVPSEAIDVQAAGEGGDAVNQKALADATNRTALQETRGDATMDADTAASSADAQTDTGSGPYEGRTLEQLRNAARAKGVAVSGSKDELVARLRG